MTADPHSFPLPPTPFSGDSRIADPGAPVEWLRYGWGVFEKNPGVWVGLMALFLVLIIATAMVPLVGGLAAHLLLPLLIAGMLTAVRKAEMDEEFRIGDLFLGFKEETSGLVLLGVLYMAGWLIIEVCMTLLGGSAILGGFLSGHPLMGMSIAIGGMFLAFILSLALSIPLFMATWFSPALVLFNHMQPWAACKASFHACLKNLVPFLVFGIIFAVLAFVAALPMGLGFLVLGPGMFGARYASYRDIFPGS